MHELARGDSLESFEERLVLDYSMFREFFFLKEYLDFRLFPGQFSKKLLTDSFFFD